LSKAKIQLRNVTYFLQDSKVNLILGDLNLDIKKEEKTAISTEKFMMNGLKLSQLLI
jgi:ABC-type multidrug transport system fused ATPase/permease subunit